MRTSYWPSRVNPERVLWLPYAVLRGGLYYELYIAPRASGCRRVLGFTRVEVNPVSGRPFRGKRLEPIGDPRRIVEEVLRECSGLEERPAWSIEVAGRGRGVWSYFKAIAERLLMPSRPPRVRVQAERLEEYLASSLARDVAEMLGGTVVVEALAYRPFMLENGVLVDAAGLGDGHDRVLSWLLRVEGISL